MTAAGSRSTSRLAVRISGLVDSRHTVTVAVLAAVLLRLPGLTRPIRADEAGFLLVARSWSPQPDSLYGPYWVDRPPLLIAVVRAADAVGGPLFLRLVGALACGLLVLAAARVARLLVGDRAARWTAVAVAAITTNTLIDTVAVKGEVLGLPLIMGSFWLALLAVRRTSVGWAFAAGVLGATALGFKQNLVGGLVFGGVLLVVSWLTGRLAGRDFARLGLGTLAGVAVPVAATVAWALAAGVRLPTLWYAVYGFRSDAALVLARAGSDAPALRGAVLLSVALGAGLALVIGGFLVHIRGEWDDDRAVTAATLAVVLVDSVALVLGGSFWRDYLFPLVPGAALCAALLARRASRRGRAMRSVIVGALLSSVACMVGWVAWNAGGLQEFDEADTGAALERAADPGDSLVVFGGRADLQLTSEMASPYPYLWSLPMRTLDPRFAELRALVDGPDAPTWLVEWVRFEAWDEEGGAVLRRAVEEGYDEHGTGCGGRTIWLLEGVDRPLPEPDCA